MTDPLFAPETAAWVGQFMAHPTHALLITAPTGSGKATTARFLSAQLLGLPLPKLDTSAQYRHIAPVEHKAISIEDIRSVIHFAALRAAGPAAARRVVVIEDAQSLTFQAQNALLKTIEEPPEGMIIILTAMNSQSILPTIRSRTQQLVLQSPSAESVTTYFERAGFDAAAIRRAILMSGNLIGLTSALLNADTEHPLAAAAVAARDILQKPAFDRLLLVDSLSKQPQLVNNILVVMERMADIALQQTNNSEATNKRWHTVLTACYEARSLLHHNTQPKLVMLNFMLTL